MAKDTTNPAEDEALLAKLRQDSGRLQPKVRDALGPVVPILHVDIRPTDVDPRTPAGIANMKRVLGSILVDEHNRITVKDERGAAVGVRNFNEIYPQVVGPKPDGRIELEYHEQATLGWFGDVLWSMNWFVANGVLGIPRRLTMAACQALGVSFVLEEYYRNWLASILDEFNQRGLLPGYVDAKTGAANWTLATEVFGRNIIVKPAAK